MDFDRDGDLDFSLANNNPKGTHALYRNLLPAGDAARSVQVQVVDQHAARHATGAEVRVFAAGTRTLLGMGIVDSGGGYCSQNVMPVHVGLGTTARRHRGDDNRRRVKRESRPERRTWTLAGCRRRSWSSRRHARHKAEGRRQNGTR